MLHILTWPIGATVVQWQLTGLQVNSVSGRACTWGMLQNTVHLISQGVPQPYSVASWRKIKH